MEMIDRVRNSWLRLLVLSVLVAAVSPLPTAAQPSARSLRVLFVGNSFTFFNKMPEMFERYVGDAYPGMNVHVEMTAMPGQTLASHREDGKAVEKIESGNWDYVVLQGHSSLLSAYTLNNVTYFEEPDEFLEHADYFSRLAERHGAVPVLFQPWTAKGDDSEVPFVAHAYAKAAATNAAILAPVGSCFHRVQGSTGTILYGNDGVHPSPAGSYLAVVTIARAILGETQAATVLVPGVAAGDAAALDDMIASECSDIKAKRALAKEMIYASRPQLESGDPLVGTRGTWRAVDGGTRLSLGTELRLDFSGQQPQVAMREWTAAALLDLPVHDVRVVDNVVRFSTKSSAVVFEMQAVLNGEDLDVLTAREGSGGLMVYERVRYERSGHADYFRELNALYARLATSRKADGLANALRAHFEAVTALIGPKALSDALEGFSIDEWSIILTAWHYSERGELDRALQYLAAAVTLYPDSYGAHHQLGEGYEAAGRIREALASFKRAKFLLGNANPYLAAHLDSEIRRLTEMDRQ